MDRKKRALTRIHHPHSRMGRGESSNSHCLSTSGRSRKSGDCSAAERSGGSRTCLSDGDKVSHGVVRTARERTVRPIIIGLGAAFPRTIRWMKDQHGHTDCKRSTYGGLDGLLGGVLGTQQLLLSYQNLSGVQSEPPAITDGRIEARRARGTRRRVMRVMVKRREVRVGKRVTGWTGLGTCPRPPSHFIL